MDGKGCWRDNVFVERFWKSIKYEAVYLHAYDNVSEARGGIGRYIDFYNQRRPHRALDGDTPESVYFTSLPLRCLQAGARPFPPLQAHSVAGFDMPFEPQFQHHQHPDE
jgi:hypothetical protein